MDETLCVGRKRDCEDGDNKKLDELFAEAVEQMVKRIPVAGKEEGWLRIRRELYSGAPRRRRTATRYSILAACLAGILLLLAIYNIPGVKAWSLGVIIEYQEVLPGRVRKYITRILPDPEESFTAYDLWEGDEKLAELLDSLPFSPLVIPPSEGNWTLSGMDVKRLDPDIYLILEYMNEEGYKARLFQRPLKRAHDHTQLYDREEATLSTHSVRGVQVALLVYNSGSAGASWYEAGLQLSLSCTGGEEVALDFVEKLAKAERSP
jgi:hypothetical protein